MPKFALANDLYAALGAMPVESRAAFEEATILDRKLVCRARCNNICCKFVKDDASNPHHSSHSTLSRARLGVKGNVMVVPLDTIRMNAVVPPPISSIKDTICAVFVGTSKPSQKDIMTSKYSPVLVRRSRVKAMLQFLLQFNPYYNPINGGISYSEENLNALFPLHSDEDVPTSVEVGYIDASKAETISSAEYAPRADSADVTDQDNAFLMENVGYTDGDNSYANYLSMKALALDRCRKGMPFLMAGSQDGMVGDFNNPCILTWLFPHLDPWGLIGFFHPGRRIKLTMQEQLTHLLLSDNRRFQSDPEFAFVFYNVIRKLQVSQSIRFSVSPKVHRALATQLIALEADVLGNLGKKLSKNPNYRPITDDERTAFDVMSRISMVARHIPGSNGHKVLLRNQIRALISNQGTPTLFITLNPSDVDNPIVRLLSGDDIQLEDIQRGEDMSSWDRRLLAARHPAECAQFFHLVITKFIDIVLGFRSGRSKSGIFGICDAYFGTVEAQGKGTLHCHMLIWLRGHLPPGELRTQMTASTEYRDRVFRWVESVVRCEFPVQSHHGTVDVFQAQPQQMIKHRDLGDPNPGVIPTPSTVGIAATTDLEDFWTNYNLHIHQLLHKYNWHIHGAVCWKYLRNGEPKNDQTCRLRMNGIVREHSVMDDETGALMLRRHHPWIASYNDAITFMLKCNTDLKFIGSGRAARDLVFYVTDYVTKPTLPVHAGMAALQYAVKKIDENMAASTKGLTSSLSSGAVITAVNSMMGRHEISHPQVMSYLIGGGDHYTSHKFIVLQWSRICAYVNLQMATSEDAPASDTGLDGEGPDLDLDIRADSITISDQRMDYMYRNTAVEFDSLCLYDFVSYTAKAIIPYKIRSTKPPEEIAGSFCSGQHPQHDTHHLTQRQVPHVPVLLGPPISNPNRSNAIRENWAKEVLVLFKPWRSVADLRGDHDTWEGAYTENEDQLSDRHRCIISNMNAFSESVDARGEAPLRFRGAESDVHHDSTFSGNDETAGNAHMDDGTYEEDDSVTEFDDVFLCTSTASQYTTNLDLFVTQRVGPEVIPYLDRCHNGPPATIHTTNDIPLATQLDINDLPGVSEHKAVMSEQKKKRMHDGDSSFDLDEDQGSHNHVTIRNIIHARLRRQRIEIMTLQPERQFPSLALQENEDEDDAVRRIMQWVIDEMNLESNPEQLRAFMMIADHLAKGSSEQLLMYVSGVGGTGKSHVINSVVKLFEAFGCRDLLALGAPTGIAAVLIGGQTLHSLALLNPSGKAGKIERLTQIWKAKRCLIIDEVSMIGAKFLSQFSNRLREAKTGGGDTVLSPFGGVNVVFMGDFGQLKPPVQAALYSHMITKSPSFLTASSVDGIGAINGVLVWRQVTKVIELLKNQRQADDPVYAQFLLRLRKGECILPKPPSISGDWEYLKTRLLNRLNDQTLRSFRDAPFVVGNKAVRDALNAKLIMYHSKRMGQEVCIYHSIDTVSRVNVPARIQKRLWSLKSSENNEAFGRLPIFPGMKVMITENLAFGHGIVNGSEGVVQSIKYNEDGFGIRTAVVAYVHIPGSGMNLPGLDEDVVPIFPVSTRIDFKFDIKRGISCSGFTRKQLPFVPGYAYTDFKSQGRTLTRVIVDIATAKGQGAYVMLSRVKSLDGLAILRWFPAAKVYTRLPAELRDELARIQTLL
ncbi:hypothetical protein D9619_010532 [Psilocybe cf. subviscida]|uniref:ATP-dependent DNA helicase n=1 Tax=Psilocybe cf. subviscida TaxID=2480587 RepID=A0A8H5ERU1_9AGAR|nr:hypothetical protein D9619_010532 [Psilocybe cf. subviscida]